MKIKKKASRILAGAIGIILVLFLLVFVDAWVGNPVSGFLAKRSVQKYIDQNYEELNLEIQKSVYNFKFGSYMTFCQSSDSEDTAFSVYTDRLGRVVRDDYEHEVANNFTTFRRIEEALRQYSQGLEEQYFSEYDMISCSLNLWDSEEHDPLKNLTLDMEFDVHSPPSPVELYLSVSDPDVSFSRAAEILKTAAQMATKEGIEIYCFTLSLEYKDVQIIDGKECADHLHLYLDDIPAGLLDSDDLSARLEELFKEKNS